MSGRLRVQTCVTHLQHDGQLLRHWHSGAGVAELTVDGCEHKHVQRSACLFVIQHFIYFAWWYLQPGLEGVELITPKARGAL